MVIWLKSPSPSTDHVVYGCPLSCFCNMKAWVEMQWLADKRNEIKVIFRVNLPGNLKYTNEHLGLQFLTSLKWMCTYAATIFLTPQPVITQPPYGHKLWQGAFRVGVCLIMCIPDFFRSLRGTREYRVRFQMSDVIFRKTVDRYTD